MIPKRNIVAIYGEYSLKRIFLLQGRFYLQCKTLKWMYQIVVLSKHQQVWGPNESPLKFARKHYYFHLSREGIQSSCSRSLQNVAVIMDLLKTLDWLSAPWLMHPHVQGVSYVCPVLTPVLWPLHLLPETKLFITVSSQPVACKDKLMPEVNFYETPWLEKTFRLDAHLHIEI